MKRKNGGYVEPSTDCDRVALSSYRGNSFNSVQLSKSIGKKIKSNVIPNYYFRFFVPKFPLEKGLTDQIKFIKANFPLIMMHNLEQFLRV